MIDDDLFNLPQEDSLVGLEPTWWIFGEKDMDDIYERAGDSLDNPDKSMVQRLGVKPFVDKDGNKRLFLARFEVPKAGEDFQYQDGT